MRPIDADKLFDEMMRVHKRFQGRYKTPEINRIIDIMFLVFTSVIGRCPTLPGYDDEEGRV